MTSPALSLIVKALEHASSTLKIGREWIDASQEERDNWKGHATLVEQELTEALAAAKRVQDGAQRDGKPVALEAGEIQAWAALDAAKYPKWDAEGNFSAYNGILQTCIALAREVSAPPVAQHSAAESEREVMQQQPTSPDVRAALLFCLWHHQGGSSKIGQPIRHALGIEPFRNLTAEHIEIARRVQSKITSAATPSAVLAEREACALLVESRCGHPSTGAYRVLTSAADAIRARSTQGGE